MRKNEKLKEAIKSAKLNQTSLAKKIGMTNVSISNLVRYEYLPTKKTAYKIANALNCKVSDIFDQYTEFINVVVDTQEA